MVTYFLERKGKLLSINIVYLAINVVFIALSIVALTGITTSHGLLGAKYTQKQDKLFKSVKNVLIVMIIVRAALVIIKLIAAVTAKMSINIVK